MKRKRKKHPRRIDSSDLNFEVFKDERLYDAFHEGTGPKSSDMRFATERLSVASVSKPNSLLGPVPS